MKKRILSASVAAIVSGMGFVGLAQAGILTPTGGATALQINEAGTGHILLVPYFTTQGTNATLLNITNTDTANGKLVKVRFRGASNSDDIFDFTLALSPGDVWAAKVSQGADGRSVLETADKSCTLPAEVATTKIAFPTVRLNPALTDAQKANETREGYIEILNMADIPKGVHTDQYASGAVAPSANPLWTATKHVNGVAPCTSTVLSALLTDTSAESSGDAYERSSTTPGAAATTKTARGKGLNYPTGNLMANWIIIDTVKTATFSGAATAVAATGGSGAANIVFFPQIDTPYPNPSNTALDSLTADPLLRSGNRTAVDPATGASGAPSAAPFIAAAYYDIPDLSTPYVTAASATAPLTQAYTLTKALATTRVSNEYLTTTSIAATTDWVFSMPTRRYNVAYNYRFTSPLSTNGRVYTKWVEAGAPAVDFFTSANTSVVNGQICVNADSGSGAVTQYDREETTTNTQFVISPGTTQQIRFCGETSVLGINNGTNTTTGSLSASVATQNLNVLSNEGWVALGTSGLNNQGLPVLGGAFIKSSAFGAMWPHRYVRP